MIFFMIVIDNHNTSDIIEKIENFLHSGGFVETLSPNAFTDGLYHKDPNTYERAEKGETMSVTIKETYIRWICLSGKPFNDVRIKVSIFKNFFSTPKQLQSFLNR